MSKNAEMNVKFLEMEQSKKMELLGVDENIFSLSRFKGVDRDVVLSDLWNGKTNAERRALLKSI